MRDAIQPGQQPCCGVGLGHSMFPR
jgi:hypothetical protein